MAVCINLPFRPFYVDAHHATQHPNNAGPLLFTICYHELCQRQMSRVIHNEHDMILVCVKRSEPIITTQKHKFKSFDDL